MAKSFGRVILKISGEVFGEGGSSIDFSRYDKVAKRVLKIVEDTKIQMVIVVGGGNIFRGRQAGSKIDNKEADAMGMMATVINGIGLREALMRNGAKDTRLMTAFELKAFAEPYIRLRGIHHLEKNRLVIIAGGLGMPNFSTDSAVAQYASELNCEMILKASTVDGVYDSDPRINSHATRYTELTYKEAMKEELGVMDLTAFAMCQKSKIPVFVFNVKNLHKVSDVIKGVGSFGTLVHS